MKAFCIAASAALALSLCPTPQQGGQTCPCPHTVNTITSPDSDCEVVWATVNERDGQCPRDAQQNCTLTGSLGCDARGILMEITCGKQKTMHLSTPECQDTDADVMTPSDGGAPHTAYLNCQDCTP